MNISRHCGHHHDECGQDGHGHHEHSHDHDHHHHDDHHHDHDHDHEHCRPGPVRPGILLAAFGVARPEARKGYDLMAAEVSAQFPGLPVAWAYTAHKVRRKLTAMGQNYDSVAVALSRLHDAGVTHLTVQSLHTVPGVEYHWTRNQALAFVHPRKGFQEVAVGMPLLSSDDDLCLAARGLQSYMPANRRPDQAVILIGHGTYHQGQQRYIDFEAVVRRHDPLVFLGALMSRPGEPLGVSTVIARLKEAGITSCHLLPFMSVPGHHVQMDILGDSPRSWLNRLRAEGIDVRSSSTGTLEHKPFRDLWMEHLRDAHAGLQLTGAAPCCSSHHGGHHAHF